MFSYKNAINAYLLNGLSYSQLHITKHLRFIFFTDCYLLNVAILDGTCRLCRKATDQPIGVEVLFIVFLSNVKILKLSGPKNLYLTS
jgi:hypothetical protein